MKNEEIDIETCFNFDENKIFKALFSGRTPISWLQSTEISIISKPDSIQKGKIEILFIHNILGRNSVEANYETLSDGGKVIIKTKGVLEFSLLSINKANVEINIIKDSDRMIFIIWNWI